jgi:hypothetical protein
MSEDKKVIELTEKEKQDVLVYQNAINQELYTLGNIRRQFRTSEGQLLERLAKVENEFMGKLKFIFQGKELEEDMEGWVFDPQELKFRKMVEDK